MRQLGSSFKKDTVGEDISLVTKRKRKPENNDGVISNYEKYKKPESEQKEVSRKIPIAAYEILKDNATEQDLPITEILRIIANDYMEKDQGQLKVELSAILKEDKPSFKWTDKNIKSVRMPKDLIDVIQRYIDAIDVEGIREELRVEVLKNKGKPKNSPFRKRENELNEELKQLKKLNVTTVLTLLIMNYFE